jgi:antitoxin HigA-1
MTMRPTPKNPPHPGEILREEFLLPMAISQKALAERIGMTQAQVSLLVNGDLGVTATTAKRLAQAFGTSAEFWMNLQAVHDLASAKIGRKIRPFEAVR